MDFSHYRILIADDHALLRGVVKKALDPLNIEHLDWALNGHEAMGKILAACAQGKIYDVVLLDWNMPRMNGFDVLLACRANPELNSMAIIMMTAELEISSVLQAMKAGVTAYITKPFQPEKLAQKLEDVAALRKTMKA